VFHLENGSGGWNLNNLGLSRLAYTILLLGGSINIVSYPVVPRIAVLYVTTPTWPPHLPGHHKELFHLVIWHLIWLPHLGGWGEHWLSLLCSMDRIQSQCTCCTCIMLSTVYREISVLYHSTTLSLQHSIPLNDLWCNECVQTTKYALICNPAPHCIGVVLVRTLGMWYALHKL